MHKILAEELQQTSLSLFRKDFFSMFLGSISAKSASDKFIINKKSAVFDKASENNFMELYFHKDYRWNDASIDSEIHLNIYKHIHNAKYIAYVSPHFTLAYTLLNNKIIPKDYFGHQEFNSINIYNPESFDDWYERADVEIYRYMLEKDKQMIIIRGYGIYIYDRDLKNLLKKLDIIENSCRLLFLTK